MGFCCLCKNKSSKGSGLSFFSFPKNELLCNEWLKVCGFQLHIKNDTSKMKLCSNHFAETSFRITRKDGPKILKPGAIPSTIVRKTGQVISIMSCEKSFSIVDGTQKVLAEKEVGLIKREPEEVEAVSTSEQPSAVTTTTSQLSPDAEKPTTPKKRQIWGPRHALDMSPSHFSTPRKAKRNLDIIKSEIKKKNMRIRQLLSKTYRMRKKIQILEN